MSKNINKYLKGFLPLFVLLTILSCKKEITNIGVNLRPDNGAINGIKADISNIIARSIPEDSLRTDTLSTNILGVLNDPVFGQSSASLICQPILPADNPNFTSAVLDSITLKLKFKRSQIVDGVEQILVYGDLNDAIEIDVYKVDEELFPGNRYYSNSNITLGDQIGTFSGRFFFYDSVEVKQDGDTFMSGPELFIKLDNSFGNELLSQASSVFSSNDNFLDYLKGIALVPRLNQPVGEGVIAGIDASNAESALTVYYNGTESFDFIFNSNSERIGLYNTDNQTTAITSQHASSGHFNTTYVQAMGGSKVKIDIPGLDSIIEKGELVVINEAKLTVTLQSGSVDGFHKAPSRLLMLIPDPTTGSNFPIIDFIDQISPPDGSWIGYTNYGGSYESSIGGYEFHFNRHLQSLIEEYNKTGINNFDGFYILVPSDFPITPSRAVLNTDPNSGGIQVSVTYTKLN